MTDNEINQIIAARERLTNRRDEQVDWVAVAHFDAVLATVPPGTRNDVDLLLGRLGAVLPERVEYGPQPAPSDYRIANRTDNPNWHGVAAWFDEAAGLRPSTDTAAATEAVAELAQKKQSDHDAYLESIADQHEDRLDFLRLCSDLAI